MITLQEMSMLTTLYTQPHRHYHNINHINDCLTELENMPPKILFRNQKGIDEHSIVEKAIWYHDAVYNPYSVRNELNSISLLPTITEYNASLIDAVRDAILATMCHTITQDKISLSTQVMLDIDLSGFGKPTSECLENGENVRNEYYKTNNLDFYTGRLKFLQTIMERESLYYTDYFRDKYHEQSQKNMKIEVEIAQQYIEELSN